MNPINQKIISEGRTLALDLAANKDPFEKGLNRTFNRFCPAGILFTTSASVLLSDWAMQAVQLKLSAIIPRWILNIPFSSVFNIPASFYLGDAWTDQQKLKKIEAIQLHLKHLAIEPSDSSDAQAAQNSIDFQNKICAKTAKYTQSAQKIKALTGTLFLLFGVGFATAIVTGIYVDPSSKNPHSFSTTEGIALMSSWISGISAITPALYGIYHKLTAGAKLAENNRIRAEEALKQLQTEPEQPQAEEAQ